MHQERRRTRARDEVDRLRGRVALRRAEVVDQVGIGQRQEVIGPGETNEGVHRASAGIGQPVRITGDQRRELGAGGMSHQRDVRTVRAVTLGRFLGKRDRLRDIGSRLGHAHRRVQAIVRHHDHDAALGKSGSDESVVALRAGAPAAAVHEHHQPTRRRADRARQVDIEGLARATAVRNVRQTLIGAGQVEAVRKAELQRRAARAKRAARDREREGQAAHHGRARSVGCPVASMSPCAVSQARAAVHSCW